MFIYELPEFMAINETIKKTYPPPAMDVAYSVTPSTKWVVHTPIDEWSPFLDFFFFVVFSRQTRSFEIISLIIKLMIIPRCFTR